MRAEKQIQEEDAAAQRMIRLMAAGDPLGVEQLYELYAAALYGLLLRMLSDRMLAEEVLQDVFVRGFERAAEYDAARGRPFTWLAVIARRMAIDQLRKRRRRTEFLAQQKEQQGFAADTDNSDGSQFMHHAHDVSTLLPQLQRLTDTRRRVLEAAYFEGRSHAEISRLLDLPIGTVKSEIRRGILQLREYFFGTGNE